VVSRSGSPGTSTSSDTRKHEATVIKSALDVLPPNQSLACRVIGGWPHGYKFKKPVTLKVRSLVMRYHIRISPLNQ